MSTSVCTDLNPFNFISKHLLQIRLCLIAQRVSKRTVDLVCHQRCNSEFGHVTVALSWHSFNRVEGKRSSSHPFFAVVMKFPGHSIQYFRRRGTKFPGHSIQYFRRRGTKFPGHYTIFQEERHEISGTLCTIFQEERHKISGTLYTVFQEERHEISKHWRRDSCCLTSFYFQISPN